MTYAKGSNREPDRPALERFAEKCAFDPMTGCVMWVGGTTSGRGHKEPYGAFWFEGRRWFAHRWAAVHVHGLDVCDMQVDHNCPHGPSTLCVEHVKPETPAVNREYQTLRLSRPQQSLETVRYWIFVQKGLTDHEPARRTAALEPYAPPLWLQPFLPEEVLAAYGGGVPF